jgi:hypothetical protein
MHKIDRFLVIGNAAGDLLFAWAPSCRLARPADGFLYAEHSRATGGRLVVRLRETPPEHALARLPDAPKLYGSILVRLQRNPAGRIDLPAARITFAALISALLDTAADRPLPHIDALVGDAGPCERLLRERRAAALFARLGCIAFPEPHPITYDF